MPWYEAAERMGTTAYSWLPLGRKTWQEQLRLGQQVNSTPEPKPAASARATVPEPEPASPSLHTLTSFTSFCQTFWQGLAKKGAEGKAISELPLGALTAAFIRAGEKVRLLEPRKRSENTLRNLTVDLFVKQSEQDDGLQALFTQLGQDGKGFDLLVEGESSASLGNTALIDLGSAPALTCRPLHTSLHRPPAPPHRTVTSTTPTLCAGKDALIWFKPLPSNSTRRGKVFHMDLKGNRGHGGE